MVVIKKWLTHMNEHTSQDLSVLQSRAWDSWAAERKRLDHSQINQPILKCLSQTHRGTSAAKCARSCGCVSLIRVWKRALSWRTQLQIINRGSHREREALAHSTVQRHETHPGPADQWLVSKGSRRWLVAFLLSKRLRDAHSKSNK